MFRFPADSPVAVCASVGLIPDNATVLATPTPRTVMELVSRVSMASDTRTNASITVGVCGKWGLLNASLVAVLDTPSNPRMLVFIIVSAVVRFVVSLLRFVVVISALALRASSASRMSLPFGIVLVEKLPNVVSESPTPSTSRRPEFSAESAVLRCCTSVLRLAVVVSAFALSASSASRTSLPLGMVVVSKFPRLAAAALTPSKARRSVSRVVSAAVRCCTSVEMASERFSNASVAVGVLVRWGLLKESVAAFSVIPSTPLRAVLKLASAAVRSFVSVLRLVVVMSAFALSALSAPRTSLPLGMVVVAKFSRWVASPLTPSKVRRLVLSWVSAVVRALCSAAMPADRVIASFVIDCALAAMVVVCEDRVVPCACCSVSSVEIWFACAVTSDPVEPVDGCNAAESSLIVSSVSAMSVPPRMLSMACELAAMAVVCVAMFVVCVAMFVVCVAMFVVCVAMSVVCVAMSVVCVAMSVVFVAMLPDPSAPMLCALLVISAPIFLSVLYSVGTSCVSVVT